MTIVTPREGATCNAMRRFAEHKNNEDVAPVTYVYSNIAIGQCYRRRTRSIQGPRSAIDPTQLDQTTHNSAQSERRVTDVRSDCLPDIEVLVD